MRKHSAESMNKSFSRIYYYINFALVLFTIFFTFSISIFCENFIKIPYNNFSMCILTHMSLRADIWTDMVIMSYVNRKYSMFEDFKVLHEKQYKRGNYWKNQIFNFGFNSKCGLKLVMEFLISKSIENKEIKPIKKVKQNTYDVQWI